MYSVDIFFYYYYYYIVPLVGSVVCSRADKNLSFQMQLFVYLN